MQWFLCSDLEELLHQLGVGREGATHSHNRKRRSITGSSQEGARQLLDGCNHETGGLSQDWAQVRLRRTFDLKENILYWEWQRSVTLHAVNCMQVLEGLIWRASYSSTNLSFPLNPIRYVFQPISCWIFLLWILICQFPRSTSDKFAQPSFSSC